MPGCWSMCSTMRVSNATSCSRQRSGSGARGRGRSWPRRPRTCPRAARGGWRSRRTATPRRYRSLGRDRAHRDAVDALRTQHAQAGAHHRIAGERLLRGPLAGARSQLALYHLSRTTFVTYSVRNVQRSSRTSFDQEISMELTAPAPSPSRRPRAAPSALGDPGDRPRRRGDGPRRRDDRQRRRPVHPRRSRAARPRCNGSGPLRRPRRLPYS